jgi:hypothetical protein
MNNLIRIWLMGLGFMFASQALAAESAGKSANDGNLEAARAAFQRGVELFHEGDFTAALLEFQKADRIGPSYRIQYNIAQTYYELHDYVASLKAFKLYLANGEAEIPAARKSQVEDTIQRLQARIASLDISVGVEGALVSLDDVPVGVSPLPGPVPANPGLRRVSAVKAGMPIVSRSVTVSGGDRVEIALDLRGAARSASSTAGVAQSPPSLPKKAAEHSHTPLILGLVATGACAVTTGIFGWLALRAQSRLDRDLDTYNVSPNDLNVDRSRLRSFALVTDIAAGATLLAGGLSLYLALTGSGDETARVTPPRSRLVLTPTRNGVALQGGW